VRRKGTNSADFPDEINPAEKKNLCGFTGAVLAGIIGRDL
jgi:hypothetical protein